MARENMPRAESSRRSSEGVPAPRPQGGSRTLEEVERLAREAAGMRDEPAVAGSREGDGQ